MDPSWLAEQQRQQMERLRHAQMGYAFQHAGRGAGGRSRAGVRIGYAIVWLILAAILAFIILALVR